jgi:hypothetical protein
MADFAGKIAAAMRSEVISNALFADLKAVSLLLQEDYSPAEMEQILSRPEIIAIQSVLPAMVAKIETELEKAEAQKQLDLLEAESTRGLEDFVFYNHYKNLVRKEWLLYQRLYTDAELRRMRFVFAGCGAMPMTAIGMAETFGVPVDCYDIDLEASRLADKMMTRLGLKNKMGIYHGNALDIDYSRYDIVILANLARPQMQRPVPISDSRQISTSEAVAGIDGGVTMSNMTDRWILLALCTLVLVTFGAVAYDQLKDRGIPCHVRQQYLYCPEGTTWKYVVMSPEWRAVNLYP